MYLHGVSVNNLSYTSRVCFDPANAQNGRRHALSVQPDVEFEIVREQTGCHRRKVDTMVYGSFEGQRPRPVAKREHTDRHTVCQRDFAIRVRLWVSNQGLQAAIHKIGDANRGEIKAIEKRGVVKRRGGDWLARIQYIQHTVGCSAGLLNSGIPLADDASSSRHALARFHYI